MGQFADAIRELNTKGAGVLPGIRLTKKRARLLLDMVYAYRHEWNRLNEESPADNDMQAAVHWLCNQIFKRWSQNELYTD